MISARRPLASALATSANPSKSASLAARSPTLRIVNPIRLLVKYSSEYLTMAERSEHDEPILRGGGDCDDETGRRRDHQARPVQVHGRDRQRGHHSRRPRLDQ